MYETFSAAVTSLVTFEVASYDTSQPLIIDPVLSWATYLGSSNYDEGNGIAVDAAGHAYVTGSVGLSNFPVTAGNVIQNTFGGGFSDAFVTKLNATGTALVYSTYLGDIGDDGGFGIAVDAAGHAYVTGATSSSNFPGTAGSAIQSTLGGKFDAFVTKLNATGTAILYSTYLGGIGDDGGFEIAVDAAGDAYVTGVARSSNFPGTAGSAIQNTFGGLADSFVAKLNVAGTAIVYSTYLGGSGEDQGLGIAVDAAGDAYVTGITQSSNFPGTAGSAIQSTFGGTVDAFVAKLNATGTAILYSTYLGGIYSDEGHGIAVDAAGDAYVTGVASHRTFRGRRAVPSRAHWAAAPMRLWRKSAAAFRLPRSTRELSST